MRAEGCGVDAQVMEQKQLQKEAAQRLNVMVDELRNSQNADLSAKNLGEEGCIYHFRGPCFQRQVILLSCMDSRCFYVAIVLFYGVLQAERTNIP